MEPEAIGAFSDEYREHVHASLEHLQMLARIARRTRLYERIDKVGWTFGSHEQTYSQHGVFGEQATELGMILEDGRLDVSLLSLDELTVYERGQEPIVVQAFEEDFGEEDLACLIEGDTALIEAYSEAYGEGLRGFVPVTMKTSVEVLEEHPELADWVAQNYPGDIKSRRAFVIPQGMYEWYVVYDWFHSLIDAWRIVNGISWPDTGDDDSGETGEGGDTQGDAGASPGPAAEGNDGGRPGGHGDSVRGSDGLAEAS